MLAFRRHCYQASQAHTTMAERAEKDLQWFMAQSPARLSAAVLK
jgi:hypothetical protein